MSESPLSGPPVLKLFGGAVIQSGHTLLGGAAAHRHRLALLAILAVSGRPISRDKLVAYLWPERDTERARNLLRAGVHELRKMLGEGAIVGTGDLLSVDPSLLRCDVAEFEAAVRAGDLRAANELYTGPFLDGFFLKESNEFEEWSSAERARLERLHEKIREVLGDSAEVSLAPAPALVPSPDSTQSERPRRARWLIPAVALLVVAIGTGMALRDRPTFPGPTPPIPLPDDVEPGTALEFNGATSAASTPVGTVITTQVDDIAIDLWVKYEGWGKHDKQVVYYNGHGGVTGWGIVILGKPDGQPDGTLGILAGGITISATPLVLKKDVWQHVSAERREGKMTVALDDSIYPVGNFPVNALGGKYQSIEKTSLGNDGSFDQPGNSFHGAIDRLRIRTLAANYWIDRWYFDEGKGTTASGYKSHEFRLNDVKWVPAASLAPREVFWSRLQSLCGLALSGTVTASAPGDSIFARSPLIIHAHRCTPTSIRFALHVGSDHSREVVVSRIGAGLRMSHDAHLEGGAVAPGSGVAGDTRDAGAVDRQTFVGTNGDEWRLEIDLAKALTYAVRRGGTDQLRIEFPIERQVASPPPPWGQPR